MEHAGIPRDPTRIDLLFTMSEIPHVAPGEDTHMRIDVFADVGVERYLIAFGSTSMSPSSFLQASPGTLRPASVGVPREA